MDQATVGRRIRSWMVDANMTQEGLAKKLCVSTGALKSWIYGTRSMSFDTACSIADAFGKSLDELACREKTV